MFVLHLLQLQHENFIVKINGKATSEERKKEVHRIFLYFYLTFVVVIVCCCSNYNHYIKFES